VALEDMQVCFIPKVEVMSFFDKKISFQWMSWNHLWRPQRCWWAHGQYGSKNSEAAISRTLLYLENTFGKNTDGTLKIQLSRDELSSMIGTATESCIRLYQTLKVVL
jgi:hypothetical protein